MKAEELIELGFTREYVSAEENGSEFGFEYYIYCVNDTPMLITNEKDDNIIDFDFGVEFFYHSDLGSTCDVDTVKKLINVLKEFKQ